MKKTTVQFIIDSLMAVCLLLLVSLSERLWHEIIGVIFFILFAIRVLIRMKDIKKLFSKKGKAYFVLQSIILIDIMLVIISGICISKNLFSFLPLSNQLIFRQMHIVSAALAFLLISINIGLNINFIKKLLKSVFKKIKPSKAKTIAVRVIVICSMAYGLYACFAENICKQMIYSFSENKIQQNQMLTNSDDKQMMNPPADDDEQSSSSQNNSDINDKNESDSGNIQQSRPNKPDDTRENTEQLPPGGSQNFDPNNNSHKFESAVFFKSLLDYSAILIFVAGATHALVLLVTCKKRSKVTP